MGQIKERLDPNKPLEGEWEMAKVWTRQEDLSPSPGDYEKIVAEQWHKTGCFAAGAPYVVRMLLRSLDLSEHLSPEERKQYWPFAKDSPEVPKLADKFLAPDCAGAGGLSEAEIANLKAIAARAAPQAPKP